MRVKSLMERRFVVYTINPKPLDRFRDRFSPAGAKDNRRDARALAVWELVPAPPP